MLVRRLVQPEAELDGLVKRPQHAAGSLGALLGRTLAAALRQRAHRHEPARCGRLHQARSAARRAACRARRTAVSFTESDTADAPQPAVEHALQLRAVDAERSSQSGAGDARSVDTVSQDGAGAARVDDGAGAAAAAAGLGTCPQAARAGLHVTLKRETVARGVVYSVYSV